MQLLRGNVVRFPRVSPPVEENGADDKRDEEDWDYDCDGDFGACAETSTRC